MTSKPKGLKQSRVIHVSLFKYKTMKIILIYISFFLFGCFSNSATTADPTHNPAQTDEQDIQIVKRDIPDGFKAAYFASGCFWCVEAVYESVKGVHEVISGYAEGSKKNAKYELVASGLTKHVEAIEVIYDPEVVSYETLIVVFYGSGDPTTLNQQGPDRGYQYRSAIYYQNLEEKEIAERITKELTETKAFKNPIVTDITPYTTFFDAEEYHQDFEVKNPNQGYVKAVSVPRLKRFQAKFPELLKEVEAH